jgi:RHH-type proline utilization regulon transcriptional repressor/proline dehydrogenase/delta 1-pyrroline-5-carboxylate dehydrogenase
MEVSDVETDGELAARIATSGAERLRVLVPVDDVLRSACHEAGIAIDTTPVTHHGRVELPCWLREQAISWTRHRHGRVPSAGLPRTGQAGERRCEAAAVSSGGEASSLAAS